MIAAKKRRNGQAGGEATRLKWQAKRQANARVVETDPILKREYNFF